VFFGKVEGGLGLFCTGLRSCSFLSCFPGIGKVRNLAWTCALICCYCLVNIWFYLAWCASPKLFFITCLYGLGVGKYFKWGGLGKWHPLPQTSSCLSAAHILFVKKHLSHLILLYRLC
jgi:hypothetical protein